MQPQNVVTGERVRGSSLVCRPGVQLLDSTPPHPATPPPRPQPPQPSQSTDRCGAGCCYADGLNTYVWSVYSFDAHESLAAEQLTRFILADE